MRRLPLIAGLLAVALGLRLLTQLPSPVLVRVTPDQARPETPAQRGRVVYERYGCALCHGADGRGGFTNRNAETAGKVPAVLYVAEGYTVGELRRKILDGVRTVGKADPQGPPPPYRMPGWADQMTDEEVQDLVQYLVDLYPESEEEKWR